MIHILKSENGKYCARYSVVTPFKVVKKAPLPLTTSAQQSELYAYTWACTLAKSKTAQRYTDSRYPFPVLMILVCKENNVASLLSE